MLPPNVKIVAKDEKQKALDIFTMAFVNDPANGLRTMTLPFDGGFEMTVKVE